MSIPTQASHAKWRLLSIFAHPDDEVFSCGGVMALNRQRGIYNALICATKGEAGEISLPELATSETIGLVREQELLNAAHHLGVDDLYFLGYRDSGMAGTEQNNHPAAYTNADAAAVVPRLVRFIRAIKPQVVITFDPTGGYGHPDHIAINKHSLAAFHAAADPSYGPELGQPWQAQRLYYPTFTPEMFNKLRDEILANGGEPPDWGIDETTVTVQPVHAAVNISTVAHAKWTAFNSHRTQFGPKHPFLQVSEEFIMALLGTETFEQAWPDAKPEQPYTDIFEGLAA